MKSLQKILRKGFLPGLVAVAIVLFAWSSSLRTSGPVITINGRRFIAQVADTQAKRLQGLSGQDGLAHNQAMLFVFDAPEQSCFWMKDMKFDIDILWFDQNKTLVWQKLGATPQSYPESFCPDVPTQYVVEVAAGAASFKLGDTLITP